MSTKAAIIYGALLIISNVLTFAWSFFKGYKFAFSEMQETSKRLKDEGYNVKILDKEGNEVEKCKC